MRSSSKRATQSLLLLGAIATGLSLYVALDASSDVVTKVLLGVMVLLMAVIGWAK